jgi:hypothetical protein
VFAAEFEAYRERLCAFCIKYIDEIEQTEGQSITHAIAHHSFLNPIVICDVNAARVAAGKPAIPFSVFVHVRPNSATPPILQI